MTMLEEAVRVRLLRDLVELAAQLAHWEQIPSTTPIDNGQCIVAIRAELLPHEAPDRARARRWDAELQSALESWAVRVAHSVGAALEALVLERVEASLRRIVRHRLGVVGVATMHAAALQTAASEPTPILWWALVAKDRIRDASRTGVSSRVETGEGRARITDGIDEARAVIEAGAVGACQWVLGDVVSPPSFEALSTALRVAWSEAEGDFDYSDTAAMQASLVRWLAARGTPSARRLVSELNGEPATRTMSRWLSVARPFRPMAAVTWFDEVKPVLVRNGTWSATTRERQVFEVDVYTPS